MTDIDPAALEAVARAICAADAPGLTPADIEEGWLYCVSEGRAAIRALREHEGWKPINSAPRDGRIILLTSTHRSWKYPFPAKWDKQHGRWVFADEPLNDIWAVSDLITHWQPLPPPPAQGEH